MKVLVYLTTLCFLLIPLHEIFAQEADVKLDHYRVLRNNGERTEGLNGVLTVEGILKDNSGSQKLLVPRNEIRVLDRYVGNHGGSGALVGAGVGFLTAVLGYAMAEADASNDPYKEVDDSRVLPLFIGFTGGGALIGWLVGSSMKKWERVPLDVSASYDPKYDRTEFVISFTF